MIASSRRKVVFIASLGHSGSTLLDLVLGGHDGFIGLGEIANAVTLPMQGTDGRGPLCSCGNTASDCPFWSQVSTRLEAEHDSTLARRYEIVLDTFATVFGNDAVPVDSSKYLGPLGVLHRDLGLDVRVLFLLKDVRNFTISEIDNVARKRAQGLRRRGVTPLGSFRTWHASNREMQAYFDRERMPVFQFGYEEFCLVPDRIARKACAFLEVDFQPAMLGLEKSRSHILRGNRMRGQSEKSALSYDHRWFGRHEWMLPSLLCRRIMRFNREQVYSNGLERAWEK